MCTLWFYSSQTLLNYLAFQSFDFKCTWWRLFQTRLVCTKLDTYVFISCHGQTNSCLLFMSWSDKFVFDFRDKTNYLSYSCNKRNWYKVLCLNDYVELTGWCNYCITLQQLPQTYIVEIIGQEILTLLLYMSTPIIYITVVYDM